MKCKICGNEVKQLTTVVMPMENAGTLELCSECYVHEMRYRQGEY